MQSCAVCGYIADTDQRLPQSWADYLTSQREISPYDATSVKIPLCIGCRQNLEYLRQADIAPGEAEIGPAARSFLDQIDAERLKT